MSDRWEVWAACAGAHQLFLNDEADWRTQAVVEQQRREVCAECPVLLECREAAMQGRYQDLFAGGMTGAERDEVKRAERIGQGMLFA